MSARSAGEVHEFEQEVPLAAPRKPPSSKEAIPFRWKIVGKSGELNVVLSKYVDRESAEKELARLEETGMYADLAIREIEAVITQSRSVLRKIKKAKLAASKAAAKAKAKTKGRPKTKAKAKTKLKTKTKLKAKTKLKTKVKTKTKTRTKARAKTKRRKK